MTSNLNTSQVSAELTANELCLEIAGDMSCGRYELIEIAGSILRAEDSICRHGVEARVYILWALLASEYGG